MSAAIFASAPKLLRAQKRGSSIASCMSMTMRTASAGKRMGSRPSRRKRPIVEFERHVRLIALALAQGKVGAGAVLGRDSAQSQRPDIVTAGQRRCLDHLAPGEQRVAG